MRRSLRRDEIERIRRRHHGYRLLLLTVTLVLLLQRPGADGLIRRADGDVEASSLSLQLAPAFPALAPREQQRRAELWLQWARDLGYDHLELRDSRAGLLGRDALVGDGMILFSSEPSA